MVSYLAEEIMDYFVDGFGVRPVMGKPFSVEIEYFHEHEPLGNVGVHVIRWFHWIKL